MPPTARLPTVEFRSLLLPPIRIRLRTLHAFSRPQCAPVALHGARLAATCLAQRRSLHLYKTARAKTALGMQKILGFSLYELEPPGASNHRVNLVKSEFDHTLIAQDVSLQELYDYHIGPGKMLYMAQPISKKLSEDYAKMRDEKTPAQANNFAIVPAHSIKVALKTPQTEGKQLGALKGVHMALANPIAYTKEVFDRAYQFIEQGSPVEFRVRLLGSLVKKKVKIAPPSADAWPWMHAHFPHLRPDFILKSMPERTEYIIKPVSDGRTVQFVLGRKAGQMHKLDLTKRVFRVKRAVAEAKRVQSMAQDGMITNEERLVDRKASAVKTGDALDTEAREVDEVERADSKLRDGLGRYRPVKQEMGPWRKQHDRQRGMDRRGKW